jgi:tetratricopeptide (TPR) repeat protein
VERLAETHPGRGTGLIEMEGNAYYLEGNYAEAAKKIRRAVGLIGLAFGPESPEYGRALLNLANAVGDGGDLPLGRSLTLRAITLIERAWGRFHPLVSHGLNNLSTYEILAGDFDAALRALDEAIEIKQQVFGPDHPEMAFALVNRGSALHRRQQLDAASASYRRALAIFEQAHGPDHPTVSYPLAGLGWIELDRGAPRRAIPFLERAMTVRDGTTFGDAERAETRFLLARALWDAAADRRRARALARQARVEQERAGGDLSAIDGWLSGR